MCRRRYVTLEPDQREELLRVRDHDPVPHMRTKAAAVLKVAAGHLIKEVAAFGLNRPFDEETVSRWISLYEAEGGAGWRVKAGRGRKPAFFPSPPRHRGRRR